LYLLQAACAPVSGCNRIPRNALTENAVCDFDIVLFRESGKNPCIRLLKQAERARRRKLQCKN
jgi:hypothetical protein